MHCGKQIALLMQQKFWPLESSIVYPESKLLLTINRFGIPEDMITLYILNKKEIILSSPVFISGFSMYSDSLCQLYHCSKGENLKYQNPTIILQKE